MSLLENLFSPGTIERLGWMLVHFLWQAMAVALLLAGLLRLLRRASANLRYAVACGALALMAVLPLITMQLIEVSGPVAEAGPPPEISSPAMVEPLPVIVQTVDELPPLSSMPPLEAADLTVPIPLQERVIAALEPALPYVVLGWLAGVFGLSAWHLGGWAQLQRLRRRMTRKTEAPLRAALVELAERLGVRRAVTLLESAVVEVPTVVGWLRPVILLPASALTGLSPDQLRAILAHELAHIRRYDYFANILQTVVEILGFYHPAVWWVSTRIRIERENCCDDLAVQVCGNSLQYARALASMEEIRHSRSDLAMAASGGSLMARIARLLGRPAVDDRRFAWLPGLVALLLVIGVIIPAALVFATPAPAEPEPAEAELPAQQMAAPEPNPPLPDEPARAQVLLSFTVIDVFADRVFDLDTAVLARDLLRLIRPADANRPLVSTTPPIIEELLLPQRDVFARFEPIPLKSKDLADLLLSRGYAKMLSKPKILTFADGPASLMIGQESDPNAPDSPSTDGYMKLAVTPHVLEDQDAVRLSIDYKSQRAIGGEDDPNRPIFTTQIASTFVVPDGQAVAVVAGTTRIPHAPVHLLLVGPIRVIRPERAMEQAPGMMGARAIVESPTSSNTQTRNETLIPIDWMIAKALTEAVLDRETLLLIGTTLARERPEIADEITGTDPGRKVTLGKVLRKYVTRQSISSETGEALFELLTTRGLVEVQLTHPLVAADNRQFEIRKITEEWFPADTSQTGDKSALKKVEYGTVIKGTPHVASGGSILMEMAVTFTEPAPQAQPTPLPVVRTMEVATTVTVPDNRYFSLLVESTDRKSPQTDVTESLLVMLKPRAVEPIAQPSDPSRGQIPQGSIHPPQVLLDVRTISVERSDLMNLGVEWSFPVMEYPPSGGSNWLKGVSVGYAPDRRATEALEAVLARSQDRIQILSSQQVVGLEGRLSRVRAVTEEWFRSDRPQSRTGIETIASGTILSFTPRVGDANEITLEVTVEDSKALPRGRDSDLPIITRRQAKNSITVQNGGTMAIAGLTDSPKREPDRTAREIAVLVTATLVTESHQAAASPSPRQMEFAPPRRIVEARERHVNADPLIREMSAQVVRMERDLIVSRQILTNDHPEMVQKKTALQEFKNKLQERQSELEQEFDGDVAKHPAGSGDSAIEIVTARQAYVNADLLVQEFTTRVVETQKELVALQQTVSPSHPTLRQKSEAVEVFKRKLDERRAELERKFDTELMVENSRAASPGAPPTSATSTNTDLFSALAQISKQSGVKIAVDLTVKPQLVTADLAGLSGEAAIRQVLKGTPYAFKCVTEADPPTYLVYRPIDIEFQGADLRLALQDIATKAELPVLPDSSVSGKVAARIEYASLEEALTAVLAGTHYVFKKASGRYIVTDGRPAIDGPARGDVPQVHLTATLATVLESQRLDRDTATEVFNLIAPAGTAPAEMSLTELRASTVGQILRQLGQQIPADRFKAVVRLLASKGFLDNVAEPQMVVPSGRTGEMMGEGQAVKVHVEALNGGQIIRLDAEASMQIFKPIPNDEKSNPSSPLTSVRKAKGSGSLEVPNDRHGLLALGGMSSGTDQADAETCYLILHPALVTPKAQEKASEEQTGANANRISQARPNMRQWNLVNVPETRHLRLNHQTPQRVLSLLPAKYQKYVHTEADNTSDSNQVLTVTAPSEITYTVVGMIRDFDSPPPQIFLNGWIVEMERADLPSLGVQWSLPTGEVGQTPADSGRPEGIQIGSLGNPSLTDAFMARLRLLGTTKRARILTNDQIVSQDGRPTQLLSIPEVWANYPSAQAAREASRNRKEARKILAGRLLSIVPHLGDHNDITFDIPVHVSNRVATKSKDNLSNRPPSDIPGVTGRQATSSITITNGGTIVIAGLAKNTGRQSGRSREIAIFATASLIPARGWIENSLAASPHQSRVSVTPPPHENLLTVLAQICESSSIQIAVDPTVKRQSATADLIGLSGEAAIQQALKDTPYVFRRVGETDPPLYLVYRPITAEFDGVALGYALQDLAAKAEVPILPRGSMSGKVRARIENASLAEALNTVLTGTPYTVRKGQNCYFVAE